jgi:hypothetical protein
MAAFDLTTVSNLFKIKYGPLSMNAYNSANVLLGRCKKEYDFVGKRMDIAVPLSFSGGVGSGSLPTANYANYQDAQITAKKVYSTIEVEREALKASMNDEGAFVQLTKESVKKGVESFNRNMSRILFNDASGALGQFSGNAAGTATAPILTILNSGTYAFNEANFEEKDYVNVNSLSSVWEITAVDPATRAVTLSRISGSDDLTAIGAGTHTVYMQNSRLADPQGLKGALDATTGTLYGVTVARRWQAYQLAMAGAGLTADTMNKAMLEVERRCGKVPNMIVTSYTQYRKLLNILEDQKRYMIDPRAENLKGKVSFNGLEFMSSQGPVGVFADRFCDADRMYFLNDNFITIKHRPESPGWADDDGTVFLRKASSDNYEARYCLYGEVYIAPTFHGVVTGLAV